MKIKHKGNTIIEVLVALMILMIASMMAMTSSIAANKSKIRRESYEKLDRVSYCIMNEIKYNYSYDEINKKILQYNSENTNTNTNINSIGFKYTDDILENLITTNFLELDKGNDIKLEVIDKDNENKIVKMRLNINVYIGGEVISIEREFNKSWWM